MISAVCFSVKYIFFVPSNVCRTKKEVLNKQKKYSKNFVIVCIFYMLYHQKNTFY